MRIGSLIKSRLRTAFGLRREGLLQVVQVGHGAKFQMRRLEPCPTVGSIDDPEARVRKLRAFLREQPRDAFGNLIYPENPDAEAEWFPALEEVCKLTGQPPPAWPTRRSLDAAIDRCTLALEAQSPMPAVVSPPLAPADAAKTFLAWLRSTGRTGEHTDMALRDLYLEHCAAAAITPSPETTMRKFLAQYGGVDKKMTEAGKNGPHRRRTTVWIIKPSLGKAVEQMRRAA